MSTMSDDEEMKDSSSVEEEEEEEDSNPNFTPIHEKKRLPQPVCLASLCPTMDLIAIGLRKNKMVTVNDASDNNSAGSANTSSAAANNTASASSSSSSLANNISYSNSIFVYRTMSWQKMFVVTETDLSNALSNRRIIGTNSNKVRKNNNDDDNNHNNIKQEESPCVSQLSWSPDGRALVIGLNDGSLLLYDIESSVSSGGVPPKPVVFLPSPPPSVNMDLKIDDDDCDAVDGDDDDDYYSNGDMVDNTTNSGNRNSRDVNNIMFSPIFTRSMAAARRNHQQIECRSDIKATTKTGTATSFIQGKAKESSTYISNRVSNNNSSNKNNNNRNKIIQSLFETQEENSILSLQWQRMNPIYKDWNKTTQEENDEVSWSFQSYYLDKATYFLPPCAYNATYPTNKYSNINDALNELYKGISGGGSVGGRRQTSENFDTHNDFEEIIDRYRPKCETPLSILFSVTAANGIHLYLQGRYRLLSLPSPIALCNHFTSIKATSDLSCVVISIKETIYDEEQSSTLFGIKNQQPSSAIVMYSIPSITKNRYQLQTITSSFCSITSHLTVIHDGLDEAGGAWSGALRQLDMKFDQLSTLLTKYGVMPSTCTTTIEKMSVVRMELLNYILGGHSKRSTETSNAMDQFFTNPLMNDQLLQRLIRPLEANVSSVEGIIRKKILGPVRALIYDVGELHGLVKVMNVEHSGCSEYDDQDDNEDHGDVMGDGYDLPLMNEHTSLRLYEASEVLYFVAHQCVSQIVEIRIRLNNMMKWIRGTASQVKARGTAIDSVQRENARKRRVPEQIVRKIADFLSTTLKSDGDDIDGVKRGSSECILGILFSDYFHKEKVSIEQSPTPLKQKAMNGKFFDKDVIELVESPSVKAALEISTQIAMDLFEEPRLSIRKTAIQKRIHLEEHDKPSSNKLFTSIHSRIGAATNSIDAENCFNPSVVGYDNSIKFASRHWIIIANTCNSTVNSNHVLQITALPKDHLETKGMEDIEEDSIDVHHAYYLTTFIGLPNDCQVSNIVFYGDDGNSTLTSETYANNEEGRQALGLLLERNNSNDDMKSEEVWLFSYDDLDFRMITLPESDMNDSCIKIQQFDASSDIICLLTNAAMTEKDDETEFKNVSAKWRQIRREETSLPSSHLIMSGSKGIGGITSEKLNVIDIFDLEEDECESDSDEE